MHFEKQPPQPLDAVNQKLLLQTPLHYACYRGDVDTVDSLLGRTLSYNTDEAAAQACICAMIEEEDAINGWTPAHWAACYGQLTCLMKLHVRPSVGFDKSSERSNTSPLHLAAQTGAILCLKWLLQCGAAINKQDFMGETALHKAAKAGNTDSAAMLVSHGSALEVKNHRGSTPAHLAELANHPALAQFLRRCTDQQRHNFSQTTRTLQTSALPISDLNLTLPRAMCLHSPFVIPSSFSQHCVGEEKSVVSSSGDNCCINMNGEEIHQSMCGMRRHESEFMSSESLSSGSSQGCGDSMEGSGYLSNVGMKRSLVDDDDDDEDTMQDMEEAVVYPNSKRRCFVNNTLDGMDSVKYRNACNNNIISSYNAVLAMGLEPMHGAKEPLGFQSSVQEHQACVMAQQGYDSSMMNSFNNVFM